LALTPNGININTLLSLLSCDACDGVQQYISLQGVRAAVLLAVVVGDGDQQHEL
jgi:hypothetical protein